LRRSVRHKRQHRRQEKPHPRCRRVDGAKGTAELFAPCLYSNPGARGVPFRAPHSTRSLPILLAVAADALINPVVLLFDPAVEGRSGRALTSARPRVIAAETIKRNSDCFRSKGCAQSVADLHDSYPPFDPQRGIAKGILSSTFGRIMHCNALLQPGMPSVAANTSYGPVHSQARGAASPTSGARNAIHRVAKVV
jgi:hypothetical protein